MTNAYQLPGTGPTMPSGTATTAASPAGLESWLEARGLDPEVAARLGWTASNGCIEIPYYRDGVVQNRKYRSLVGKDFHQDGGTQFFWNIDTLKDESLRDMPLIVTEGEFDALAAIQCGYPRTMSVPNGATVSVTGGRGSLKYLDEVEDELRKMPEIILAFDDDAPGINLQHDFAVRLGKARCKWLRYPKGCKDLNDALRLYGPRGVTETIRRASWIRIGGVHPLKDLPPAPYRTPLLLGIPGMERHFNPRFGDFVVVTGIPGHGKSAFVADVVCHLALNHDVVTAMASFEEEPTTDLRRRLRTWHAGKLEKHMAGAEKAEADDWINRKFLFVVAEDEDEDITMEWLLEKMAAAVVRHGARCIVIDPWNEMDHLREKDQTMTEYTGHCIKVFKRFARKYGVLVIVVAHPAKMLRGKDGVLPVPSLYDISDSAHWYNKPDVGIVVHRGEDGDIIRIAKSKHHGEIGKPGDVHVDFDQSTGRYRTRAVSAAARNYNSTQQED